MPTYIIEKEYDKNRWQVPEKELIDFIKGQVAVSIQKVANKFAISYMTARKYLLVLTQEDKLEQIKMESDKGNRTYRRFKIPEKD